MKTAKILDDLYMSDFKDKELMKKYKKIARKKNKEYDCTYLHIPCKVIGERKIMREIQFKDGSTTTITYNELNAI